MAVRPISKHTFACGVRAEWGCSTQDCTSSSYFFFCTVYVRTYVGTHTVVAALSSSADGDERERGDALYFIVSASCFCSMRCSWLRGGNESASVVGLSVCVALCVCVDGREREGKNGASREVVVVWGDDAAVSRKREAGRQQLSPSPPFFFF